MSMRASDVDGDDEFEHPFAVRDSPMSISKSAVKKYVDTSSSRTRKGPRYSQGTGILANIGKRGRRTAVQAPVAVPKNSAGIEDVDVFFDVAGISKAPLVGVAEDHFFSDDDDEYENETYQPSEYERLQDEASYAAEDEPATIGGGFEDEEPAKEATPQKRRKSVTIQDLPTDISSFSSPSSARSSPRFARQSISSPRRSSILVQSSSSASSPRSRQSLAEESVDSDKENQPEPKKQKVTKKANKKTADNNRRKSTPAEVLARDGGRGQRNRMAPLHYWNGSRPVYAPGPTKSVIDIIKKETPQKRKRTVTKEPPAPFPSFHVKQGKKISEINIALHRDELRCLGNSTPHYRMEEAFKVDGFRSGQIMISPESSTKEMMSRFPMSYCMIGGRLEVTITDAEGEIVLQVRTGDHFYVPAGTAFRMSNPAKSPAKAVFFSPLNN